jgi:hypothetical protein
LQSANYLNMHSMHHNLHQATQNKITSWLTTIITIG